MKIKRLDFLTKFYMYEHYIKERCPMVRSVYCDSLYFFTEELENKFITIQWGGIEDPEKNRDLVSLILNAVNTICSTEFVFED